MHSRKLSTLHAACAASLGLTLCTLRAGHTREEASRGAARERSCRHASTLAVTLARRGRCPPACGCGSAVPAHRDSASRKASGTVKTTKRSIDQQKRFYFESNTRSISDHIELCQPWPHVVSAFETYRRLVLIQSLRLITTSTWYGRIRKSRRTSNLILRALAKKNTAMHRHVPAVSHVPESAKFKHQVL